MSGPPADHRPPDGGGGGGFGGASTGVLLLARAARGAEPRAGADAFAAVRAEDGVGHAVAGPPSRPMGIRSAAPGARPRY